MLFSFGIKTPNYHAKSLAGVTNIAMITIIMSVTQVSSIHVVHYAKKCLFLYSPAWMRHCMCVFCIWVYVSVGVWVGVRVGVYAHVCTYVCICDDSQHV